MAQRIGFRPGNFATARTYSRPHGIFVYSQTYGTCSATAVVQVPNRGSDTANVNAVACHIDHDPRGEAPITRGAPP